MGNLMRYAGMGMQMVATIVLFLIVGWQLDVWQQHATPWFTFGLALLGCIVAMYAAIRQYLKLTEEDHRKP